MSVFSNLRYPISMPPTRAQLEALPRDLYNQWVHEVISGNTSDLTPELIAEVLGRSQNDDIRNVVERLRCLVYGLDE